MGNMPHVYRDRDIKRVIKAARDAGIEPGGVKVNPKTGEITVLGRSSIPVPDPCWDQVIAKIEQE